MLCNFIVIYILATLAIGLFVSKFIKNPEDFALAGKRMPVFITASALFATWFGSETIMGASSEFVEHGLIGVVEDPFGAALCLLLVGIFFAKILYNMNLITMGDLFARRYGPKAEIISSFFMIVSYFGWTSAQLIAFAIVLKSVSGLDTNVGIWLAGLLVLVYTYAGGMWAITITDFVQTLMIIIGLVLLTGKIVGDAGGLVSVVSQVPRGFWNFVPDPNPQNILDYFTAWITIGLGSIPQQDVFQRIMSARCDRTAVRACIIGSFMYLSIAFMPLLIALASRQIYPDIASGDSQTIITDTIMRHGDLWMQIMFYGALLSAIMSTASGSILASATPLAENVFKPLLKNISQNQLLVLMRISVVIMTLLGIWLATISDSIFVLVSEASALSLVTLFVPFIGALWWKSSNSLGAILSMVGGFTAWFIFKRFDVLFLGVYINRTMAAFAVSFIAMCVGILYEKIQNLKTAPEISDHH
ncbi:MAG: hypothetical protein RLZZ361_102 [Cyanobacteriota bacterium]|jgi:SSS family transporter